MANTRKKRPANRAKCRARQSKARVTKARRLYDQASRLSAQGDFGGASRLYERLRETAEDAQLRALVRNDLASLHAADGQIDSAIKGFQLALTLDPNCLPARLNLALLEADAMVEGRESRVEGQNTNDEPGTIKNERLESGASVVSGQSSVAEDRSSVISDPSSLISDPSSLISHPLSDLPPCLLLMVTYNRLEYTRLAVEAVLRLDYPALQIVVWDNGSSDGTVEFLRSRLDGVSHVRLELSPRNMGVVHPMNAVWGGAAGFGVQDSGFRSERRDDGGSRVEDGGSPRLTTNHSPLTNSFELLAKVDNDTLVPPDLIRRLAECHVQSKHFGVLSGFHFRKQGETIAEEKHIVTVNGVRVCRQNYVGGCAVMLRREVFERVGPIPCRSQSSVVSGQSPGNGPFLESGWTQYQQQIDELGLINGYPWPPIHVDHMEDTRSPHCILAPEHLAYKQAMRGMSLQEFTDELCVWRPH